MEEVVEVVAEHAAITAGEEGKKAAIWVKHYCSSHQILLVGEGDFSFSLSLAQSFGSGSNILASSLDSYDTLIKKYKKAKSNLEKLQLLGAALLHGVDATNMKVCTDLKMRKFDRIIFNFPHAGFHGKEDDIYLIKMHRDLVHGFFWNASGMIRANGQVHVNHKTTAPYNHWNLEELASQNSLELIERVKFKKEDYPGYNNKRGDGPKCDDPFPLGESSTYKFRFSPHTKKMPRVFCSLDTSYVKFQQYEQTPVHTLWQQPIVPYQFWHPQTNFTAYANYIPRHVKSPPTVIATNECSRYFTHVGETFGRNNCDVYASVFRALKLGLATYMSEAPGRDLNGYINLLEELHRFSILRFVWLQRMLDSGH